MVSSRIEEETLWDTLGLQKSNVFWDIQKSSIAYYNGSRIIAHVSVMLQSVDRERSQTMKLHELAGKPAPRSLLVNVPRLVAAYYTRKPDVSDPAQRVSFGTSGHRGSSLRNSFNEDHILAISQAVVEYRRSRGITGPLFMGMGYARPVRSCSCERS